MKAPIFSKTIIRILTFLILVFVVKSDANAQSDNGCQLIIKYYVKKVTVPGKDMDVNLAFTINPNNKTVVVEIDGKVAQTNPIKITACSLNANLSSGYASFETKDAKGQVDYAKIEAKNGKITITNTKPITENDNVVMEVQKWELIKP
jgi:hypothetical protein